MCNLYRLTLFLICLIFLAPFSVSCSGGDDDDDSVATSDDDLEDDDSESSDDDTGGDDVADDDIADDDTEPVGDYECPDGAVTDLKGCLTRVGPGEPANGGSDIAMDADKLVHLVYTDGRDIVYRHENPDADSGWDTEVIYRNGVDPRLAVDGDGTPHFLITDIRDEQVFSLTQAGGERTRESLPPIGYASIVDFHLNPTGEPCAVSSDDGLWLVCRKNGAWSKERVSALNNFFDLRYDANGNLHILQLLDDGIAWVDTSPILGKWESRTIPYAKADVGIEPGEIGAWITKIEGGKLDLLIRFNDAVFTAREKSSGLEVAFAFGAPTSIARIAAFVDDRGRIDVAFVFRDEEKIRHWFRVLRPAGADDWDGNEISHDFDGEALPEQWRFVQRGGRAAYLAKIDETASLRMGIDDGHGWASDMVAEGKFHTNNAVVDQNGVVTMFGRLWPEREWRVARVDGVDVTMSAIAGTNAEDYSASTSGLSADVDAAGQAYMTYLDREDDKVYVIGNDDGIWSAAPVPLPFVPDRFPTLKADDVGGVHLIVPEDDPSNTYYLQADDWATSTWSSRLVVDYREPYIRMAVEADGRAHLLYRHGPNYEDPGELFHLEWINDTWETEKIDESDDKGLGPLGLVRDGENGELIVYYKVGSRFVRARRTTEGWQGEISFRPGYDSHGTASVVEADGAWFSYHDSSDEWVVLRLTTDDEWIECVVDSAPADLSGTLGLDENGNIYLSYWSAGATYLHRVKTSRIEPGSEGCRVSESEAYP